MSPLLFIVAFTVAAPALKEAKADPSRIEGEWVIQSYVLGGEEDRSAKGEIVHFTVDRLVVFETEEIEYTLDPKAYPSRINLKPV
jgi:hypothetical protein